MTIKVGGEVAKFAPYSYESAVRSGFAGNDLVYACIREIATSAAEARLVAYRTDTDGALVEVEGRIGALLRDPNPGMTQFEFLEAIHQHLNIAGNVYFYKVRALRGVQSIFILRPDRVRIMDDGGAEYLIDNDIYALPAEDFGHLKLPHPLDDHYGLSPLAVLGKHINLDSDLTDFQRVFFANAGVPSGLLKLKKQLNNKSEADKIRAQWRAQFRGVKGWHQVAVLDQDAEYQKTGASVDEVDAPGVSERVESRICAALRVPPILVGALVGLKHATSYANYGEARKSFWEETLIPEYKRIQEFLQGFLSVDFAEFDRLEFDLTQVRALQPNQATQSSRLTSEWTNGVLSLNEVREKLGYDPIEGGDVRRVPMAVVELAPGESIDPVLSSVAAVSPRAASRLHRSLDRVYARAVQRVERDVSTYFNRVQDEFAGRVGRLLEAEGKAVTLDVDALLPESLDTEFAAAVSPGILSAMELTWEAINNTGILEAVQAQHWEWDPNLPPVQHALNDALRRLTGPESVNGATRRKLKAVMQRGLENGYTLRQIADGVPDDQFPGLRSLVRETYKGRATTIARTEIRTAQNQASAIRYEASGIQYVEILDGDDDDECGAAHGSRWTVKHYRDNPIAHPNCTRTATPVVEP